MKIAVPEFAQRDLDNAIIALCAARGAGARICPLDAAREFACGRTESAASWHDIVPHVRRAAIGLANAGHLVIYSNGRPVDPVRVRGDYRFGLARID